MHFTTRTAGFSWLLPQPGGFECISFVEELAEAHDHPVPDREQLVIEPANLRTAPGPPSHLDPSHQHFVPTAVHDSLDLEAVLLEAVKPPFERVLDPPSASI